MATRFEKRGFRLGLLVSIAWIAVSPIFPAPIQALKTEKKVIPIAVLDSLTGSKLLEGRVVYVDFWASWCVPCRRSLPWMADLVNRYGEKGLRIVAINVDKNQAAARKFLSETRADLPVVYDPDGKLAKLYDLQVMPTSFLYAKDGSLKLRKEGFDPKEIDELEKQICALLDERAAP